MAVNQVGVGEMLPDTLFTDAVASLALATGLAFGLGGRDLVNRKLDNWYETGSNKAND